MHFAREMGSTDESFSHTGYETKDYFLTETYVEFNQESMTEQRFLEDVDYDDAAIGEMLFKAYREQVYHSQREGLSVGHSSSSVSDRTVQPVVGRTGRPNLNKHRLGLFWTDRGGKSSLTVRRRLENTNSRLIMTEEVNKNWMKRSSRSKKNFIVLKQTNDVDKIINFFKKS